MAAPFPFSDAVYNAVYPGWGRTEAQADWNNVGDQKYAGYLGGGGQAVAGSNQGAFNFDYGKATQQSYDQLGAYYKSLLDHYEGNMNKVLARLTQDYETGVRQKTDDTATARTAQDTTVMDNALSRGLYQKSNYDTTGEPAATPTQPQTQGFGIPTQNFKTTNDALDLGLKRYIEQATQTKTRSQEDQAAALTDKTDQLEQSRRTDAANMASQKATQAYNSYATAPTLA